MNQIIKRIYDVRMEESDATNIRKYTSMIFE